jgi:hypothetical protein
MFPITPPGRDRPAPASPLRRPGGQCPGPARDDGTPNRLGHARPRRPAWGAGRQAPGSEPEPGSTRLTAAGQPPQRAPPPVADDQQVAGPAGGGHQHLTRRAAHHQRPGAHARRKPAECRADRIPQPLPCVVCPQLPQFGIRSRALGHVTARRQPRQHRNQDGITMTGKVGRAAQCPHTPRRSAGSGKDQAPSTHRTIPSRSQAASGVSRS